MSLCKVCKNEVRAITVYEGTLISCSKGILKGGYEVKDCSHFEERPKDNSKNFDEAKQTANKGKPPRRQPNKILKDRTGRKIEGIKAEGTGFSS